MLKKLILTALASLLLSASAMAMPNPMVSYPSIYLCESTAGFSALTMPPGLTCKLDECFVIDKRLIQLDYSTDANETITIRTASKDLKNPNISGIYSVEWEEVNIGDLYMHIAHMENNNSAAYWSDSKYSYSIQATNVTPKQFFNLACKIYMSINPEP